MPTVLKSGQLWLHSNGYTYVVLYVTNTHAEPEKQDEYPVTIVYTRYTEPDQKIWSKPVDSFLRSRVYVGERDN